MWQVGTSPGYKKIKSRGKKYQGSVSSIHRELSKWNNDFALGGKSDHAGMFILDRKEAIIVITGDFLFHSTILTVDCILITIPSMYKSIVKGDALI